MKQTTLKNLRFKGALGSKCMIMRDDDNKRYVFNLRNPAHQYIIMRDKNYLINHQEKITITYHKTATGNLIVDEMIYQ